MSGRRRHGRLDEWGESDEGELLIWPMYERCRALLAAGRGLPGEAEEWAAKAIARAASTGVRWDELEALRARGIAALIAHKPARAIESLRDVWEHTQREGVDDPGAFPVAPDLVEALAEVGEHDEALEVTARLRELAERQQHPWGLATAKRCARDGGAVLRLRRGGGGRDGRKRPLSTRASASASTTRERCSAWVGRSAGSGSGVPRATRCSGRPRRSTRSARQAGPTRRVPSSRGSAPADPRPRVELTPTERRVAELAAAGRANKEIARDLFVSVKTVEAHLSHVYAKLGIRSRAQLTHHLSPQG